MILIAKERGYWGTIREPGDEFEVSDNEKVPVWAEKKRGRAKAEAPEEPAPDA